MIEVQMEHMVQIDTQILTMVQRLDYQMVLHHHISVEQVQMEATLNLLKQ